MERILSEPLQLAYTAIDTAVGETPDDSTALIAAKCRALMAGYDKRWNANDYVPIEVERVMMAQITNPATGRKGKLYVAGKLDVLARCDGKTVIIDHKTTSDDIADPASSYWRQLVVEAQPSHYMLLKWMEGQKVDGATWDAIRKPTISPKQLKSKAERATIISSRKYFNQDVSDDTLAWLADNDRENLEMYEARLYWDCTEERPTHYFQRRSIPRLDSELFDYANDLWDAGQLILEARRKNRWQKHPASCMAYGRPCQYLGICSGFDHAESQTWKKRESVHSELTPEQDRNTLTYSSIRCFQTCPKLFYYRYDLGIERVNEERSEALFFGTLMHTALEVYWLALAPAENENVYSDSCAANSAASGCTEALPF